MLVAKFTTKSVATFAFSAAIKIAVVITCVIKRLFKLDYIGTKLARFEFAFILNYSLN